MPTRRSSSRSCRRRPVLGRQTTSARPPDSTGRTSYCSPPMVEVDAASDTMPPGDAARVADEASDAAEGDFEEFGNRTCRRARGSRAGGSQGPTKAPIVIPTAGRGWLPLGIIAAVGGGRFPAVPAEQAEQGARGSRTGPSRYRRRRHGLRRGARGTRPRRPNTRCRARRGQQEYARALDLYENAKTAAAKVERPGDLQPVTSTLDEGRWLLACVRARLAGEEPPERGCRASSTPGTDRRSKTFNGRHRAVRYAMCPACAADATRIKGGLDPDVRLVSVGGGERRPYWDAGTGLGRLGRRVLRRLPARDLVGHHARLVDGRLGRRRLLRRR